MISRSITTYNYEIVERKGIGHPDTIADALAEFLSCCYSMYTYKKFGYVLHHDFDKIGIIGGKSRVEWGGGEIINPVKIMLNCRASISFAGNLIPLKQLLKNIIKKFLKEILPLLPSNKVQILYNLNPSSSPGHLASQEFSNVNPRNFWFCPRGPQDLPELKRLFSNDTVIGLSLIHI